LGTRGIGAIKNKDIGGLDKISEGLNELKKGSREKLNVSVERAA
jgi:hypothetical protein